MENRCLTCFLCEFLKMGGFWCVIWILVLVNSGVSVSADKAYIKESVCHLSEWRSNVFKWKILCSTHEALDPNVGDCQPGSSFKKCMLERLGRKKRQAARPVVGIPCSENIDCQTLDGGSSCSSAKRCSCMSAFVSLNGYCWRRINPGQSGCQYTAQCEAVWPGTSCSASGICTCSNSQPPHPTKDGPVCILDGNCPTNGPFPKIRDPNGNERQCLGSDQACMATLLYDCICNPTPSSTGINACSGVTYCCPSRGWACSMPSDVGNSAGNFLPSTRYFYNTVVGRCEPFVYRGLGGNANNFFSQSQCDSYCSTAACSRGSPSYNRLVTGQYERRRCTSGARGCGSGFACSSDNICCPARGNLCSNSGGVPYPGAVPTGPDVGLTSPGIRPSTRYFYDSDTGTCRAFTYNGVGGNYNNFATDLHCKQYCTRTICEVGEPLLDSGGDPVKCGGSGTADTCPRKYQCTDDFCCPTAEYVCRLPRLVGACSNFVTRYYFDPDINDCVSFTYSGCQGNMNNFERYDTCQIFCQDVEPEPSCPVGKSAKDENGFSILCGGIDPIGGYEKPCPLNYFCYDNVCCPSLVQTCLVDQADAGTTCVSGGRVIRWAFSSTLRICESFRYNGCDGNSNNFATRLDCDDYCRFSGCPDHGSPYFENGRFKTCSSVGSTSYDCPANYMCTAIMVPYTDRNGRGFYCCPTRVQICSLARDSGTTCGTSTLTRYFYNTATKQCESFTFNGCGGNDNNFPALDQCTTFCASAGCPFGQLALTGKGVNDIDITCDSGKVGWSTCTSNNGICLASAFQNATLCCGSTYSTGVCPSGQRPYVDSLSARPLQCAPNLDMCPAGYACYFDPVTRNSYCCGLPFTPCPDGRELLTDTVINMGLPQPRQCTPELVGSCPSTYSCEPITITVGNVASSTGHCCSMENPCGTGYTPLRDRSEIVKCTDSVCPSPYQCLQGTCCAIGSTLTNVCSTGRQPLYRAGVPALCIPSSVSASCPGGYTCDLYAPSIVYYCCGFPTATVPVAVATTLAPGTGTASGGCPSNSVPVNPLTYCSPDVVTARCPANSFCTYDSGRGRFVCCTIPGVTVTATAVSNATTRPTLPLATSVCPRGRMALVDSQSGRALACSEIYRCPRGYSCVYSPNGDYCCSVPADSGCPNDTRAYIYSYSNTPLVCLPNSGPKCPTGYDCTRNTITRSLFQCCSTPVTPSTATLVRPATRITLNITGDGCPLGSTVYIYTPNKTPLVCIPNGQQCPAGYSCTQSSLASYYQCCSLPPTTTTTTIPSTTSGASSASASAPASAEAAGRSLVTNTEISPQNVTGCPPGSEPYLFPNSALPLACDPNGPPCPKNYRCVQSNEYNGTMICCRVNAMTTTTSHALAIFAANEIEVEIELTNGAFAGEPCVSDEECRHGAGSKSTCRNGFCICASNEVNLLGLCTRSGCPSPYRNVAGKCVVVSPMELLTNSEKMQKSWPPDDDFRH